MRMTQRVFFLVLWIAISSGMISMAVAQGAADPAQEKDRAGIAKAVQNYMDLWNTHNLHAVAMTYTEDCDFTNNFGDVTHGRAGMEATFGPFMTGVYSETHQTGKVRSTRFLKPDVAAVDVDWEMTGAKNQDGTVRPTRKGLHSLVMTKQSDGSWLIAIMHVHEFTNTPRITNPALAPLPPQTPAR
ncbi:MAG: SgcJ/EcaC family oxidoreductase [Acidobacteriia bacterium]|nr:SgcJ/EcaC family oxidoreductase [Terriglobia bacterium]